jgi:hypothetical protein
MSLYQPDHPSTPGAILAMRLDMIRQGLTHADVLASWTTPEAVARFEAQMAAKPAAHISDRKVA